MRRSIKFQNAKDRRAPTRCDSDPREAFGASRLAGAHQQQPSVEVEEPSPKNLGRRATTRQKPSAGRCVVVCCFRAGALTPKISVHRADVRVFVRSTHKHSRRTVHRNKTTQTKHAKLPSFIFVLLLFKLLLFFFFFLWMGHTNGRSPAVPPSFKRVQIERYASCARLTRRLSDAHNTPLRRGRRRSGIQVTKESPESSPTPWRRGREGSGRPDGGGGDRRPPISAAAACSPQGVGEIAQCAPGGRGDGWNANNAPVVAPAQARRRLRSLCRPQGWYEPGPASPRMVPLSPSAQILYPATHGMPRLHAHAQVRCKGGVPCLRCWKFGLVCRPQEPLPASPRSASSEQQPPATPAVPPPAAATETPAADAHADNNSFLAAFLRQWNPALIAPAVVAAVATLLPAAGDASMGEESAAAGSASLLDRGLVEAAM